MMFIGIDPGVSGGIAAIDDRGVLVRVEKMPATNRDTWDAILELVGRDIWGCPTAMIEKLGGMPRVNGKAMQSPTTMHTMGKNFGALLMALTAADVKHTEVLPRKWQAEFNLVFPAAKNLTSTQKKNFHKEKAQQLFPGTKVTHFIADALLIAEYCRRVTISTINEASL